jgi:RimJ/RimL family protein N-acetyltransferase
VIGEVDIRPATADDAERLRAFATRLLDERPPGILSRDAPSLDEEREFIGSRDAVFLAIDERVVAGVLDVRVMPVPQESHCAILGVSVDREWRGRGLGTALIRAAAEWAGSHGVSRLEAQAFANNPRAIALYERLGFEHEGRRVGAVMVDGEPVDVVLLCRRLAT